MNAELTNLTVAEVDAALEAAGYTENNLITATFVKHRDCGFGLTAIYVIVYPNGHPLSGGCLDSGFVYVSRNADGVVIAEF